MNKQLITCRLNEYDGFVINEVYRSELYNLKKYIKHDIHNFIDIGAHIGAFTLKALDAFSNISGYCYEPNIENFKLLQHNTKCFKDVKLSNSAVCGDLIPSDLSDHSLNKHNINVYNYNVVENTDINNTHIKSIQDELGFIDLVKIDCEGGEHSIFEHIDFSKIGYLLCEFHTYALHKNLDFKPFYKWVIEIEKHMKIVYRKRVSGDAFNFIGVNRLWIT